MKRRGGGEEKRESRWCWPLHRERGGWSHLSRSRWSDATDNEKETPPRPARRTRTELVRTRSFLDAACPRNFVREFLPPCITRGFAVAVGIRDARNP